MEELGIDRKKTEELVAKYITNDITRYHLLESEAIMRALAEFLFKNDKLTDEEIGGKACAELVEAWGVIGLLHDIDWDLTKNEVSQHCIKCSEILKSVGGSDFLIETIQSHGWGKNGVEVFRDKERSTKLQHALAASETLTGLIVASALVQPNPPSYETSEGQARNSKLYSLKLDSLKKKFKSKSFAAKCNRDIILECEEIGLTLDEFLGLGLKALQNISSELGL